ncbi:response regulator [Mucilaginibacter corticis]|uniref:Response regulator n=1 Tax=Mucilaginibacter corticis TaxID=2597670 RepID=A0A556M8Y0_9SPHI|nr:response regulator [Mucilaginibacter corticis]TSJ36387.1 response regulator [Mucilaginibacter corticis]
MTHKILLLEDNADITEMLRTWLSSLNYEVITFQQVEDIVTLAEEVSPDLVLLDYLLGGINGGEYCAQLKKNAGTQHIPVIMLSAHQRVIESLGHYGWDAFIAKPFDLSELALKISELIDKAHDPLAV